MKNRKLNFSILNSQFSIAGSAGLLSAACCKLKAVFTNFSILNSQFSILLLALLFLASCQKPAATAQKPIPNFPPQMVGMWKNETTGWILVFEKDGTMSSVTRADKLVMDIAAGGLTIQSSDQQVFANYVFGPCVWSYDAISKALSVVVTIESFYVKTSEQELGCSIIDKFTGTLSEDKLTWLASWTTTTEWDDNAPPWFSEGGILTFKKLP